MRVAASQATLSPCEVLRMVTTVPRQLLRVSDVGRLVAGARADLLVIPATRSNAAEALLATSRSDVALVTIGGRPMIAAPSLSAMFQGRNTSEDLIRVDGVERLADGRLARAIARCPIREPGVECG
jgi:cytosine/adenosine deaminase-related metal-dependent hydrolase